MTNDRDDNGELLPDPLRTTRIGRLIRKTSLDELPELINVLIGEMSLVGPRPLLMKYMSYFNEREKIRFEVKPGITGWAQINGRHTLKWEDRLEMDVEYIENWSLFLDLRIIFKTILVVLKQKDVFSVSSEFIPDFDVYRKLQMERFDEN
jgi:lipopolysaccharide/colanic/teichoic acid biosynthesis glycosyltransferase